jgi:phospholipase C
MTILFRARASFVAFALAALLAGCQGGATVGGAPAPRTLSPSPGSSPAPGTSPTPVASLLPGATPTATTSSTPTPTPSPAPTSSTLTTNPIKHIVIIIQENRTFDNLFHGFSETSGAMANYANACPDKAGTMHALTSVPFENTFDPNNYHADFEADYDNGKNDGFYDNNAAITGASGANNGCSYLPQTEVQPYWDMATNGALAENAFHGVTGPTYPSHLMFVAASTTYDGDPTHRVIDSPTLASLGWGCEDPNATEKVGTLNAQGQEVPGPFPCYSVTTLADLLQMNNNSWHYYSGPVQAPNSPITVGGQTVTTPGGNLEALASYRQIYYGSTWSTNAIQPETRVLADVTAGTLEDVTWVTPDGLNTDHVGESTAAGPQWVGAVVNAIGASQFYSSTAIFVTWDDWGGLYDHVPPPQKYAPYGLGFRIPIICISPYAKHGQLIETQLEPASILRFAEETFGLPTLGREDATANSAAAMLDFTQSPAPYKVVSTRLGRAHFLAQKPSYLPVDRDELGPAGGHDRVEPEER